MQTFALEVIVPNVLLQYLFLHAIFRFPFFRECNN